MVDIDTFCPLSPDAIKRVQDIVSTLLYYGWAADPMLLTALGSMATCQANGTTAVAKSCQKFLNYVATHPNAGISYKACEMIFAVHTNASYLMEKTAKAMPQQTSI